MRLGASAGQNRRAPRSEPMVTAGPARPGGALAREPGGPRPWRGLQALTRRRRPHHRDGMSSTVTAGQVVIRHHGHLPATTLGMSAREIEDLRALPPRRYGPRPPAGAGVTLDSCQPATCT